MLSGLGNNSARSAKKIVPTLWAWGINASGQLGLGVAGLGRSVPVQVDRGMNWSSVSAGFDHTLAIKTTGSLWAWGNNGSGRLGLGNTTARSSPVQVGTDTNWSSVSAGGSHIMAIKSTGSLWAVGARGNGRLGISYIGNVSAPVQTGTAENWNFTAGKFRIYAGNAAVKIFTTQNPTT